MVFQVLLLFRKAILLYIRGLSMVMLQLISLLVVIRKPLGVLSDLKEKFKAGHGSAIELQRGRALLSKVRLETT